MEGSDEVKANEVPAFNLHKWEDEPEDRRKQVWAVVAFFAFALGYRLIVAHGLGRSSLMFMGLPAVIAVLLAMAPRAKSATGSIVKGITFAVLLIAPLLGEGYLCILIASPLFYLVGIVTGLIVDAMDRKGKSRGATVGCVSLVLLPMCLEGISPQWSLPRAQAVEARRVVTAPAADVHAALAGSMHVDRPLPGFLRIGFPRPVRAWGSGLRVGEERGLHFTGAEGTPPGDLTMRVAESRAGYVRMETVADHSKVTEWMNWRDTEVQWRAVDADHTEVVARVHFSRGLDPAWYFTWWERFAAGEAAEYLITANATPVGLR